MSINQGDNGGGNPSNGQSKFASYPPAERVSRLHKALVSDEVFSSLIPNDFNAFVDEYSQPERMQKLHTALSQDEVFRNLVPARYEDAIEWMGFTTKPEPMGKPSPTTQMQSGRGGVDSGAGSQSGLQSSSQRRITVDDIGVAGVGGTEPEFNYEVDRQAAEEQSESLRQQRVNRGVNQINILVNAAGKEGRGLIEKGLSEGLSQREYQKLYDVLEGTQFRDYISQVNPMTDFVSSNAFRQIFADGITAGGSDAGFSTITKRGDFDKLSEQANADAVNQWLSAFDSRMQDKVGERAYRAATEQARATYGEKAGTVINNAERLIAHQSISEEERKAAALVRELNDLVGSGRELSNEEIARAAELDRQIKSAEVELGKMGTLYDPITGQFIPQMRAPEFAAEVSQREEELSEVKDLDLLKDMRRRAYFAYNEYRKKAGDKDFLYEWIPGQDVDVDRMRAAWKEFSALNRVIELNIDPATISREGENLAALRTGFMGSPNLESNRSVVEGVVDAFRRSGLTPTKEQEDRLQKSFGEQIAESIGASTNIMLKMGAEMALTRGVRGALGLNSYANAFRRALSATRLGAKAPKAVNISSKILGGAFDVAQSAAIFETAGAGAATGAGEEVAQKVVDLLTKGRAGRLIKLLSGSVGETFAEYLGELTNEISELGIDNLDEAFRETFGRDPESAMDKLLLTLATIAPFAGVSAIGREFTDSVEKYAKSQPASDVQREVLSVIDVLREADAKRKGGAAAEVGGAAATATPEVAAPEATAEAVTPAEVVVAEQVSETEPVGEIGVDAASELATPVATPPPTPTTAPALADVESTAKALEGVDFSSVVGEIQMPSQDLVDSIEEEVQAKIDAYEREFAEKRTGRKDLTEDEVADVLADAISDGTYVEPSQLYAERDALLGQQVDVFRGNIRNILMSAGFDTDQAESIMFDMGIPKKSLAFVQQGGLDSLGEKVQARDKDFSRKLQLAILKQIYESKNLDYYGSTSSPLSGMSESQKAEYARQANVIARGVMSVFQYIENLSYTPDAKYVAESYHAAKAKPEAERTAQEVSLIESVENLLKPEPSVVSETPVAETTAGNVQDTGQGQAVDTQGTQPEGVAAPVASATPTTPEAAPAPTTAPALADVESTAKALEGKDITDQVKIEKFENIIYATYEYTSSQGHKTSITYVSNDNGKEWTTSTGGYEDIETSKFKSDDPKSYIISEAYHKAKADGSNPKLVQSVENLLNQETYATKEQGAAPLLVGDRPQVSEEVRGQDTQGGEVTGEGEVKTKEGEPTQEEVDTIASKAGVKAKNLRDLYRVNRDLFGQNRIKAFASAIVMDRIIGVMAARAGVTKAEMYGKLEFRKASEANLPQGVKMQVDAWHGSPYQFDKFTTEKIGTGEGAQAFGWGLYFTDLKGIAEGYANSISASKTTGGRENYYSEKEFDEYLSSLTSDNDIKKWAKGFSGERFAKLNDVYYHILHKGKDGKTFVDVVRDIYNNSKARSMPDEQFESLIGINKQNFIDFAKNFERNLYKVSLHKGKTPDQYTWLEWDKPLNKQRANELISKLTERQREQAFGYGISGIQTEGEFYKKLANALGGNLRGGDKNASLFLLENGIDGIKYPAESISRGATSETARGFNYVVFDENAVSIEEVVKFQKDALKARGAMMIGMDGQAVIYAITDPNVSTPLHELAHVFEHYLTDAEKAAVQSWAKTKGWTTETSEAFARGFEKYLADGIAPTAQLQKIFDKFKQWLVDIYNGVVGSEIDIELNDSMRDIYARMVGDADVAVEAEPVQEGKVAKIVEGLRSDPNVTEVHVSGNDIVYSKKDKNGNPRYYEKIGGGRSNQLSKTDFEFKREIAMDNATSIADAGIPLEGEPAFLEGEDQTSLNVLDNNLVFTTTGTFPESTNEILGEEKSESETLTDEEVESAVSGDGIPLTSVSALSPKEKSEALKKANERLEASKKRLKESWNKYRGISMSTGVIITPQSAKQNVDTMFEVFRDISLYAKDWALQKAFQGVEFSKINFMEFKRENRFLFTNAGARKAVGGRFFDEAGGSMAELAFDDGVKMALDLNYDGVQSPDEMAELQRASRGEVGSVTDVILEQFNRDSKPVSAPYRERILNAFRALNSALDYNANVKKSVIKLRDMIAKTGVPNFSISEFFEKLQFAFQPGSKIDLKFKKFKKDVYGNISSIQKEYLDLIILYDNVISLEDAIAERRTKISEFDNHLVSNHDFEAKNLRKTLNDYAAGRNVPKKVKEKIDAYLASTGQTESEFKSKIRSIEGKRVLDGKISPNYQHPYNLKKDSAQAQIEVVRKKLKEKYGDAEGEQIFNDLRSRADKYFDFNRSLLKDRLDAGQISIHIYEELKDRKYVPRLWEEVDLDNELSGNPLYDVMKISGDGNAGGYVSVKMPVLEKKKSLVGGSRVTQKAIVYSDTLMHMNVAMTIRAIENHRLMQFVVNNVIPSSDAMVDFLLSQESKAKGRPLTSSEEREIRSQSQNVYELKRIGTNKDGSPKFEPPLNGFVTFVFSDGDVTRAFASRKVGSTDFMGEFKMKSGRRNRETLRLISNIMGTSLLKMSAVGLNVAFFIKQMTSMDVIHQISVLPGVKFVPTSYVRRVVGAVGLVSGKAYDRAVYSSRVSFANYFNGTMPKEKVSKFERMVEDAIAHGLDFGTGILGHSNVADFETGAKSDKLDLAFNKALDFLQAGGRDSELATRIVSWNILTASEMKKMKKKLKRDLTPEEVASVKRKAAKEVSNALNYSVRGPILDVVDSFSPFFAATVNAQKAHLRYLPGKLGRISGGEPMSAKRKAEYMANVGQIIFFSTLSSLWMFAKDDEDERDGVIPIGASDTRDAYVIPLFVTTDKDGKRVRSAWKISLDKTAGFYQLIGKAIAQSIYYGDEDNWSRTGKRPAYPVTAKDFAVSAFQTIPAVGSTPPLLSSLVSLLGNYDLYRFQDIYKGNKDARSDLQATQRTRAIFRKMARFVDPATEAMLGTNVSAQQLESAVGKVIALNNPFSQAVTWGFAQFAPEDMRGEGEKELSDLSKAMLGNMYIEARRARQDIPAGKIGSAMANIESLRTVDDVMSEIRSLTTSELNANYSDIASSISKAASTATRMDAGYPTSRQVLDLIEADGVDYAAGARVISAYQSGKSDVVRDLMSLPAGRFGPNDSFFKSLVGPNNEREDIAYQIKDEREARLEDNYVPSDYYFNELVNMGLSGDAAFKLSESLSKLKAAESK